MLFNLQKLVAGLMLFTPATYAYANAEQAALGKVRGFTGPAEVDPTADPKPLISTSGDYLTAYFCYCEYPQELEEVMGPAHYYQFEYYNTHHNTTFILTSSCPDGDIGFDITCVPNYSSGLNVLAGPTMDVNCKLWSGYEALGNERVPRYDEFCYLPNHRHHEDFMTFNKQARNLGPKGKQGPKAGWLESGTCEYMCDEHLGLSVLLDKKFPPSHQVEWAHIDDMCDECM